MSLLGVPPRCSLDIVKFLGLQLLVGNDQLWLFSKASSAETIRGDPTSQRPKRCALALSLIATSLNALTAEGFIKSL